MLLLGPRARDTVSGKLQMLQQMTLAHTQGSEIVPVSILSLFICLFIAYGFYKLALSLRETFTYFAHICKRPPRESPGTLPRSPPVGTSCKSEPGYRCRYSQDTDHFRHRRGPLWPHSFPPLWDWLFFFSPTQQTSLESHPNCSVC